MWDRIKTEPALAVNFLVALIGAAVVFGVDIDSEQTEQIVAVVLAVIALAGGAAVRALAVPAGSVSHLQAQLDRLAWKPK
jgi:hypothetical protein